MGIYEGSPTSWSGSCGVTFVREGFVPQSADLKQNSGNGSELQLRVINIG
jgi:hypothetical protein